MRKYNPEIMHLYCVTLNSGGYDSHGSYYGNGEGPLYRYHRVVNHSHQNGVVRARTRDEAKCKIREMFGEDVRFYR